MHELSLVEALLQTVFAVTEAHGGAMVERLHLRIGRLRQVVPEALSFAFQALTPGTLAEGAIFTWDEVPACIRCKRCDTVFAPPEAWFWTCPACDAPGGEVLAGEELVLESVTLREASHGDSRRP
jgi:hydrogenase nickel incorporation protein HypA/HybF